MALNAYLKLAGAKQGEIKGSVTQKGREGMIMVIAAHELVSRPPNGKRAWQPFVVTKEIDRSTPLLYNALIANETLTNWELHFWSPQLKATPGSGTEVNDFNIRLGGARVASIELTMQNNKDPALMRYAVGEQIGFTFETIEIVWLDGGITATDTVTAPT